MLTILDYFTDRAPAWTTEDLIAQLGCSKPTTYRYIRELCNAGLLLRIGAGIYVLGPRILELDLLIRRNDPVLRVARPAMRDLVDETDGDVLLANVYGNQVMNVHREDGPTPAVISYDRGRPHPLFRGSTSKAVLPFLPRTQLRRIYTAFANECRRAGLGRSWLEFCEALAPIRRDGYVIGHGELDPHVMGIAAPIFADDKRVLGSLTLIISKQRYEKMDKRQPLDAVLRASHRITHSLSHLSDARRGRRGRKSS
jgi:DNA-binding IclR family transcriptional regulator